MAWKRVFRIFNPLQLYKKYWKNVLKIYLKENRYEMMSEEFSREIRGKQAEYGLKTCFWGVSTPYNPL